MKRAIRKSIKGGRIEYVKAARVKKRWVVSRI